MSTVTIAKGTPTGNGSRMTTEDDELDEVLYHTVIDPPEGGDNQPSLIGCAIMVVLVLVVVACALLAL